MIGRNQKRILKSNDEISFNDPINKIFDFDNTYNESYGLPADIFNRYHIGEQLGTGAQGTVRLVYDRRTCETFAMKEVKWNHSINTMEHTKNERICREMDFMRLLKHPNIIRCDDVIVKEHAVYMVRC